MAVQRHALQAISSRFPCPRSSSVAVTACLPSACYLQSGLLPSHSPPGPVLWCSLRSRHFARLDSAASSSRLLCADNIASQTHTSCLTASRTRHHDATRECECEAKGESHAKPVGICRAHGATDELFLVVAPQQSRCRLRCWTEDSRHRTKSRVHKPALACDSPPQSCSSPSPSPSPCALTHTVH